MNAMKYKQAKRPHVLRRNDLEKSEHQLIYFSPQITEEVIITSILQMKTPIKRI